MWTAILMGAQAISQYGADSANAKAQKAYQRYKNAMARIGNAVNQNAITNNEIQSNEAFGAQAVGIKQSNILTSAEAEVSAAAAGVKGRSVNQVALDINRSAAVAERARQIELTNSQRNFDATRQQSAQAAENAQDYSYIPTPKLGSYLLNAAMSYASSKSGMGDRDTPDMSKKTSSSGSSNSKVGAKSLVKKNSKGDWFADLRFW